MDMSALAADMLKWERMKRELNDLEQAIKDAVLQLGKTQTVGNVRATYNAGRRRYDYEAAINNYHAQHPLDSEFWADYSKVVYDFRMMCSALDLQTIPFTTSPPSVSVKLN